MSAESLSEQAWMRFGAVFPHLPPRLQALVNRVHLTQDSQVIGTALDFSKPPYVAFRYNPEFICSLTHDELVGLVKHELEHAQIHFRSNMRVAIDTCINQSTQEAFGCPYCNRYGKTLYEDEYLCALNGGPCSRD